MGPGHGDSPTDARGPHALRHLRRILSRRKAGVCIRGRDSEVMGSDHGGGPADARGPYGDRQFRRIFSRREAAGVYIVGHDLPRSLSTTSGAASPAASPAAPPAGTTTKKKRG